MTALAARSNPSGRNWAVLFGVAGSGKGTPPDRDWLDRLSRLTAPSLVGALLDRAGFDAETCLPPDRLRTDRRRSHLLAAAQLQTLAELSAFDPILVKGMGTALRGYGALSARGATDLDLLLPPGCRDAVIARLVAAGYRFAPAHTARWGGINDASWAPLVSPDRLVQVDLHDAPESWPARRALSRDRIAGRAETVALRLADGMPAVTARLPALDDAVLLIAAALSRDKFGPVSAKKLIDAALLLARLEHPDWDEMAALAASGGFAPAWRVMLCLIADLGIAPDWLPPVTPSPVTPRTGLAGRLYRRRLDAWRSLAPGDAGPLGRLLEEALLCADAETLIWRYRRRFAGLFQDYDGIPPGWQDKRWGTEA